MITLRSDSAAETKAVAAALSSAVRPGDVVLLAGEMGAGKTAFAQGLAAALGVLDTVTSPTFTLVHTYEGRYRIHHADVFRLERLGEVADLALGELADEDDAIVLVEWGDVVASALGSDLLTVHLEMVEPDQVDARVITVTARGGRWAARWPQVQAALRSRGWRRAEPIMLILGIETATEQVSCALGGHEGVLTLYEVARGRRHAELLTPAIEFICRQADVTLDELGAIAVDVGPGLFTGMRVGHRDGQGDGAGAAGARHPDHEPGPPGLPAALRRPADRRGDRRPPRRGLLRVLPPGAGRRAAHRRTRRRDRRRPHRRAARHRARRCCASGDGALRHRERIASEARRVEFAEQWLAHPSAAPLVQLAHAKALREDWVQPSGRRAALPPQARRRDQLGDAGGRPPAGRKRGVACEAAPRSRDRHGPHQPDEPSPRPPDPADRAAGVPAALVRRGVRRRDRPDRSGPLRTSSPTSAGGSSATAGC